LETGRVARQADGAVLATYGDTTVLATVVGQREAKPGQDFFPLTVNYQEKTYAAGRIPGGYFKREGRPSEKETLTSRLIDRPIRPLFAPGFKNEVQVVITVMSHDLENEPDVLGMVAASAALTISGIPFMGPIGAARIGYKDGEYLINPPIPDMEGTELDLVMAGTQDAVMMVESEAQELSEEVMLGAVVAGHKASREVIDLIIDFAEECAKEPWDFLPPDHSDVMPRVRELAETGLRDAYKLTDKQDRYTKVGEVKSAAKEALTGEDVADPVDGVVLGGLLKDLESEIVRGQILDTGGRIDGRTTTDIRPIVSEVGVLPRTHGSSLFTRGETQAI
ncbi:MAG: polyribonucleotide nucleotidyltransferase, partial [Pseudomonadota bacterium]